MMDGEKEKPAASLLLFVALLSNSFSRLLTKMIRTITLCAYPLAKKHKNRSHHYGPRIYLM